MTNEEFEKRAKQFLDRCYDVLITKNRDYSRGDAGDALSNFKIAGEMFGSSKYMAWGVYAWKHVSAVFAFCRSGKTESEGIVGRLIDWVNYAILLYLMIDEQNRDEAGCYSVPRTPAVEDFPGAPGPQPPDMAVTEADTE